MANDRSSMSCDIEPCRRLFFLGASALVLTGCSNIIGPTSAPQIYVLHPMPKAGPAANGKVAWALAIELPDASDSLDTNRIALSQTDTTFDYYANATWSDRLPNLVQTAILSGFENSGRIESVAREGNSLKADYVLSADIRNFEAHYSQPNNAPSVVVTLIAHMVQTRTREMVASFTATQTVPASVDSVNSVVEAFDTALAAAVSSITEWALTLPSPPPLGAALR
jgi:cholesterol transport system auxiliary component